MIPTFTCERCNAPAGPSGVSCPACYREVCAGLLASAPWRAVAAPRSGDPPGETLLATIEREARA